MLNEIAKSIEAMGSEEVEKFVQEALQLKITAKQILDEGLILGMSAVGSKLRSLSVGISCYSIELCRVRAPSLPMRPGPEL